MATSIASTSVVAAARDLVAGDLDREVVLLDQQEGIYYGLNEIAARIWAEIQQPVQVEQVLEILLNEYDVDRDRCREDLLQLLGDLHARGLIEVREE